jgi:hypothetical protein
VGQVADRAQEAGEGRRQGEGNNGCSWSLVGWGEMRFLSAVFFGGMPFSGMIPASENVSSLQRFDLDLTSIDVTLLAASRCCRFFPLNKIIRARLACCSCSNGLLPQTFWRYTVIFLSKVDTEHQDCSFLPPRMAAFI